MEPIYDVETLYQETLNSQNPNNALDSFDFIGLNFSDKGQIEFKLYDSPKHQSCSLIPDNQIEAFIHKKDMYRLTCEAHSLKGSRRYIVLKNKSVDNIKQLLNNISQSYSWFKRYTDQIVSISKMKTVMDDTSINVAISCRDSMDDYSAIHMIGFKAFSSGENAVNVEWLTRKTISKDCYSENYSYDDQYYLTFLSSMGDASVQSLCRDAISMFSSEIEKEKLHVWLFAVDYYEKSNPNYKLYFKCNQWSDLKFILSHLYKWVSKSQIKRKLPVLEICDENATDIDEKQYLDRIDAFINCHKELNLYGFALGICDSSEQWNLVKRTINLYFTQS